VPTFPRATYVLQAGEFEYATHTNERTAASYFPHNFLPVRDAGLFEMVQGEQAIVAGITVVPTPGHVPHHQSVKLESDGEIAFYTADLVPTAAHLPLPYIMGYDVEPLVTLETKRRVLKSALDEEWLLIFEHDATIPWGKVANDGKAYMLAS
jgi:glyoxylase-like metal-dependent hydrolase (beta-lactamase superfamily II)